LFVYYQLLLSEIVQKQVHVKVYNLKHRKLCNIDKDKRYLFRFKI
jgi:hypothetical protein